jgi:hypothetical protein
MKTAVFKVNIVLLLRYIGCTDRRIYMKIFAIAVVVVLYGE